MSIQSSSVADGRSKYEGCREVEAIWLKKTNELAGQTRQGPSAMRICSISQPKCYRGSNVSNSKEGFPNNLTCLSLSSFQVLKIPLLGLALPEAEFDSGKINV